MAALSATATHRTDPALSGIPRWQRASLWLCALGWQRQPDRAARPLRHQPAGRFRPTNRRRTVCHTRIAGEPIALRDAGTALASNCQVLHTQIPVTAAESVPCNSLTSTILKGNKARSTRNPAPRHRAAIRCSNHALYRTDTERLRRTRVMIVVAAMIGGYMAMNIGANDVANNVGPAVGSRAISMAGAVIAGRRIRNGGRIDCRWRCRQHHPERNHQSCRHRRYGTFHLAHDGGPACRRIVAQRGNGLPGARINHTFHHRRRAWRRHCRWRHAGRELGHAGRHCRQLGHLPVLGGVIAAGFLYWIKRSITYQDDMVDAARRVVPLLICLMAFAFSTYLSSRGWEKSGRSAWSPPSLSA